MKYLSILLYIAFPAIVSAQNGPRKVCCKSGRPAQVFVRISARSLLIFL